MQSKPEWFDLEHYKELQTFELSDWYKQLNYRHGLKFYISSEVTLSSSAKKDFNRRFIAIQSGIVNIDSDMNLDYITSYKKTSVRDLSAFDFFSSASYIEREMPDKWNSNESYDDLQEEIDPCFYTSTANINIDLNASDQQIKKDFNFWLRSKQRPNNKHASKTNIQKEKIDTWADQRLLPYIDLNLYFKAKNIKIKPAVYMNWLFPESSKISENQTYQRPDGFRTITSQAEWLMDYSTISRIESQLYSNEN